MTIHQAIPAIMAEIGSIGKDRKNAQQGYQYRGIEDFYNTCQPLMVKYKVFSVPNVIDQKREERPTKSGGVLIYTILTIEYTFFAEDGTSVRAVVVGEGMDSGDKSSNKAMSVGHKYALAQMFAVPTADMVDPEKDSPEPAPKSGIYTYKLSAEQTKGDKVTIPPDKPPVDEKRSWLKSRYLKLHRSKWLTPEDKVVMKTKMKMADKDLAKIEELVKDNEAIAAAMSKAAGEESYKTWIQELEAAADVGELEL